MLRIPLLLITLLAPTDSAQPLEFARVGDNGQSFVAAESGRPVRLWGVNYDHDGAGRLIEDYWRDEWPTVVEDFDEIKALGANCVRIHLQLGRFMTAPDASSADNLAQLARLVSLAEEKSLYLIITGLGCYTKTTCRLGTTRCRSTSAGRFRPISGGPSRRSAAGARPCSPTT